MRGTTFIPQEYEVFAGLDVDKRSMAATFATHQGVVRSVRLPYGVQPLVNHVRRHFPGQRIAFAYEAGPTGYGLYDGLAAHAYRCVIAAPAMIPRAPGQRVKTNRLDSVTLAENLRGGQLKGIHIPTPVYRELRHLAQLRDTQMRDVVATKQRLKSLLLFEGLPFPPASVGGQWSGAVKAALRELACAPTVRCKLDQLLARLAFAEQQVRQTTREIRRFCRTDPELAQQIEYLMTVPGIGGIVASHLLARLGDWRELGPGREASGFLGVVPREHSTGETIARGSITHTGDGRLRSKLVQSAWAAIRQDGELREFYRAVARRHPPDRAARIAIVAVARKLTVRIAAVLRQQRPYVVRGEVPSAPLAPVKTVPQGTTRRQAEPGGPPS
jgi:transposase